MDGSHVFTIFCDSLQEGLWFKNLDPHFNNAQLKEIPSSQNEQRRYGIDIVLKYDRPDIILKDFDEVIFVLERTKEVPSGHNVGQRFGRLIAAAERGIPCVYFFPYKAYKHGGRTAGPRYVNLRLFCSLEKVSDCYDTVLTTINWPVDANSEVLLSQDKDDRVREYLDIFFDYYDSYGMRGITNHIRCSQFQQDQRDEKITFARREIKKREQYNFPPPSVEIMPVDTFEGEFCRIKPYINSNIHDIELYQVGMRYIRSDPYAGAAMLYDYLYGRDDLIQILYFPNIEFSQWRVLGRNTKTYRMFKASCEGILFEDGLVMRDNL